MSAGNGTALAVPPAVGQVVLLHDADGTVRRWTVVTSTVSGSELVLHVQPA